MVEPNKFYPIGIIKKILIMKSWYYFLFHDSDFYDQEPNYNVLRKSDFRLLCPYVMI